MERPGETPEITARLRQLEAALEQAEKLAGLGRLTAGVVHELNNPLVAVVMYADSLHSKWSGGGGDPVDLEKITEIRDAGLRIQALARELAAYARPATGPLEPLEVAPLLELATQVCRQALKEAGVVVQRDLAPAPAVEGIRGALTQVFVNLVVNAAQASRKQGVVRLGLSAAGGRVRVTVADEGEGMPPEVQARLFEPFFTTRAPRGLGLGLFAARGIVERHGGAISVESAPGQGTRITVTLPAAPSPASQDSGVSTA
jgi:signal transduction histidine kinase